MKIAINIVRVIVGLLFIFSGLIKANDPLGLSYKMQEFFDLWHLSSLNDYSLWFSIFIIAFEIIAGFALLLGWQMRLFSWLLLLLIIFFTFLTGYAYFSDKFKNCGCFGDCIPITPQTSFIKDIVLTTLILFLFNQRKSIKPVLSKRAGFLSMLAITAFSFGIQWYVLHYLPVIDCLPFKKGNNIKQQMEKPANAVEPVVSIRYIYEKDGKEIEFAADSFPAGFDSTYHFKKRNDKIIREGKNNEPPIKSFALFGADQGFDSSNIILSQPYALLIICEDPSSALSEWEKSFASICSEAKQKNIPVYAITSVRDATINAFSKTSFSDMQVFSCDNVTIRTAARTNPCIYLIEKGTIKNKQSYKKISKIADALHTITTQPVQQNESGAPIDDSTNQQPATSNQ